MTDQTLWAVLGPILAGFGVGLIVVAAPPGVTYAGPAGQRLGNRRVGRGPAATRVPQRVVHRRQVRVAYAVAARARTMGVRLPPAAAHLRPGCGTGTAFDPEGADAPGRCAGPAGGGAARVVVPPIPRPT